MSALLIDELDVLAPVRPQPKRWRHVNRRPEARPHLVALPGGRPGGVPAPELGDVTPAAGAQPTGSAAPAQLRLTNRGLAVVVVFFLALVTTAAVVLITGFLAVSDAPIPAGPAAAVVASGQG